ncbi:hypothetical protein FOG18_00875 [Legionella israelensis]|uniref:aromatic-ring hydroxylase C-terminal domain-containing protein n=1 Tax=Legionella israelensis TaxID=454 RepID=UPI00117C34BD|nr:hypothetical protein [Legionella israelensis]QDP71237.1 hypothetical protein FOG18_00875 [Legionella israelensis]
MKSVQRNIEWSTENAKRFFDIYKAIHAGDHETLKIKLHEQQKNLNYEGLDLGFIYHSNAVVSENSQTISVSPSKYIPTTLPGSRAPYVKLIKDNETISTLDLFEKNFVLFVGSEGEPWRTAASELTQTLSFPLTVYKVGSDGDLIAPENTWHGIYDITREGCVLVRPDGHVAWRSQSVENPKNELERTFSIILNKTTY